jgi:hypothetical protein
MTVSSVDAGVQSHWLMLMARPPFSRKKRSIRARKYCTTIAATFRM